LLKISFNSVNQLLVFLNIKLKEMLDDREGYINGKIMQINYPILADTVNYCK